jgi:membrane-bound serine protease (ClpP class)
MKPRRLLLPLFALVAALVGMASPASGAPERPRVEGVVLEGTIDPASAQFVTRRLEAADRGNAQFFLIEMDTPGGLVTSMRDIVKTIEGADIPVVVWIGPSGSRAGSAGAYISASSDLLAMAPGTNIGSATPVGGSGEDLNDKIVNDAAAQIAALAAKHGRNAEAYRSMVTDQANLTVDEAIARNVAEERAASLAALVRQLDGRQVAGRVLETTGADVQIDEMPWYLRLLQVLIDPNLLAIMFGLGIAAIGFELFHPGAILPGVAGAIMLLLSFLGFAVVPFNWAGLAFIALAFILFALEAVVSGFGGLAIGGIVSLVIGGLILFDDAEGPVISRPGLIIAAILIGGGFTLIARAAWKARKAPLTTGPTGIIGHIGEVRTALVGDSGHVFIDGELWAARTADGSRIEPGAHVKVTGVSDLVLSVEPVPDTLAPATTRGAG